MKKVLFLLILVFLGCSKDESEKLFWDRVEGKYFFNLRGDADVSNVVKFNRNYGYEKRDITGWANNDLKCSSNWIPNWTSFVVISETNNESRAEGRSRPIFNIINQNPLTIYITLSSGGFAQFQEISRDDIMNLTNIYNCSTFF